MDFQYAFLGPAPRGDGCVVVLLSTNLQQQQKIVVPLGRTKGGTVYIYSAPLNIYFESI